MLIGDGWAFAYIPKCGGTALRQVLNGFEAGRDIPMGSRAPIYSSLHAMLLRPPPRRRTFTIVRHPASWIRSFWQDQTPARMGGGRYLHRYWTPDLNEFASNLCVRHPGYVGQLYDAYTSRFGMEVYHLEDGLEQAIERAIGIKTSIPKVNASPEIASYNPETLDLILQSESRCLKRYWYA
jgi:hypothetical protein